MMDVIAGVGSALILSVVATALAGALLTVFATIISMPRFEKLFHLDSSKKENLIIEKFKKESRESSLAATTSFTSKKYLPLLDNCHPIYPSKLDVWVDQLIFHSGDKDEVENFPINHLITIRNKIMGRRYSNSAVLYPKSMDASSGKIIAGVTRYRAVITAADKLARKMRRKWNASLSRLNLTKFDVAINSSKLKPIYIGSDATCLFKSHDGRWLVPIHVRSRKTINYPGARMVTPAFTYESNRSSGRTSRFNIIAYNFFKEFLEEFWDLEEVRDLHENRRYNPDWLFEEEPHGKELLQEVDSGRVDLYVTGTAIDLTYASLDIGLTVLFHSPHYLDAIQGAPGCTVEHFGETDQVKIDFLDIFGEEINAILDKMKPSTAYSINKARELLVMEGIN